MVLPSSALLNCTAAYLTSCLPQTGHVSAIVASFCISLRSTVCTADRFCLKRDGKDAALVEVVIVFDAVSANVRKSKKQVNKSAPTFIFCTAAIADKNCILVASRTVK